MVFSCVCPVSATVAGSLNGGGRMCCVLLDGRFASLLSLQIILIYNYFRPEPFGGRTCTASQRRLSR